MSRSTAKELGIVDELDALVAQHAAATDEFTLGTRASQLALVQAQHVQDAVLAAHDGQRVRIVPMSTTGDKNQSQALYLIGGKGKALWTEELEVALVEGAVDCIVHSLKDVPTSLPEGCTLGAILEREDPRDALVVKSSLPYRRLRDLPPGSVVGTSSVRRVAQLRRKFPHLVFADVRGNLNTRLSKLDNPSGPYSALILAAAGLIRVGMQDRITCGLDPETDGVLYAVGQGALGIEIRTGDERVLDLITPLEHWPTAWRCLAERELLRVLEGGCSVPLGVVTTFEPLGASIDDGATLTLRAVIVSLGGDRAVEHTETAQIFSATEAEQLGRRVADELVELGGAEILADLGKRVQDADFASRHQVRLCCVGELIRQHAVQEALARSSSGISPSALGEAVCH